MSMLARYRKPGGINQLISLLESCLSKKREALLNTIQAEDKEFAELVRSKILSVDMIFKWDPLIVSEATTRVSERVLATCLKGMPESCFEVATHTMRDLKKREIINFLETLKPTPVEIESAQIKLIETVRNLEKEGTIRLDEHGAPVLGTVGARKAA